MLGPRGNTFKRLQASTGTKMSILGKGSMRDKEKVSRLTIDVSLNVTSFDRETFLYIHSGFNNFIVSTAHGVLGGLAWKRGSEAKAKYEPACRLNRGQ